MRKMLIAQFKKQRKYLLDNREYLRKNQNRSMTALEDLNNIWVGKIPYEVLVKSLKYKKKDYDWEEWLSWFWTDMWVYDTTDKFIVTAKKTAERWYKWAMKKYGRDLARVGITYQPRLIDEYVNMLEDLQLSDYVWSINRTTKLWVLNVIRDWIQNNLTTWEVAKNIEAVSETLFSEARSSLIATTEMGRAYEYWNYIPMKQADEQWEIVMKAWSTVWDENVREEHQQNEDDWRIAMDEEFSWTGELIAPSSDFNCRCTTLYEIK